MEPDPTPDVVIVPYDVVPAPPGVIAKVFLTCYSFQAEPFVRFAAGGEATREVPRADADAE